MKLRSICPIVREGIAWDNNANYINVDTEKDRRLETDGIQDVIMFHNPQKAYKINSNTYACLAFNEDEQEIQGALANRQTIKANFNEFYKSYIEYLQELFGKLDIDERSRRFYDSSLDDHQIAAQQVRTDLIDIVKKNEITSDPEAFVDNKLLIPHQDELTVRDPNTQRMNIRKRSGLLLPVQAKIDLQSMATEHGTGIVDTAKRVYKQVKRAIMAALNRDVEINAQLEAILTAVWGRFSDFVSQGGLGFKPDLVVRTVSRAKRPLFDQLANIFAEEIGTEIVFGIAKNTRGVYYKGQLIVDENGNVSRNLPDESVSQYGSFEDMADKIAIGNFKITNINRDKRRFFSNLFRFTDEFEEAIEATGKTEGINVLLVDDSAYSGTTTDLIMKLLRTDPRIGKIASYVIIKA